MTSEDKYVLSQLTNETGNLKGILKQQNKIENIYLQALIKFFTELYSSLTACAKTLPIAS